MMKTTITRRVVKQCPYVDEIDFGMLVIVFEGSAPELHELGHCINGLDGKRTHESFTRCVRELVPEACEVVTTWDTGPWRVEVRM